MYSKIAVIGAGMVGSSFAYAAAIEGVANEIALIDLSYERAEGEAMDLNHCLSFLSPMNIYAAGYEACKDAQVVVVTAGAATQAGQSRLEVADKNVDITRKIVGSIMEHAASPVLLMVSNPVDVLTYTAVKESGLPKERVIGSGTVLDTARFRYLLADSCKVDPRNVHGYVIGEHGDSELALWSRVNIAGVPLESYCEASGKKCDSDFRKNVMEDVRTAAYKIIERKGATYYAIGLGMVRIVEAILNDQKSALCISTLVDGQYGLNDVCLSLPCLVGRNGAEQIIEADIAPEELEALHKSAGVLRETIDNVGI